MKRQGSKWSASCLLTTNNHRLHFSEKITNYKDYAMNYLNLPYVHRLSTLFVFILLLIGIIFLKRTSIQREVRSSHLHNKSLNLKPYLVFKKIDRKSPNAIALTAIPVNAHSMK